MTTTPENRMIYRRHFDEYYFYMQSPKYPIYKICFQTDYYLFLVMYRKSH